jgi:hypothetical protein
LKETIMASSQGGSGGTQMLLLVVLIGLVGLCVWNYRRNAALEVATPSPYASLADEDVERLLEAYKSELERMKSAQPKATRVRDNDGVVAGIHEFDRVARHSRSRREAGYEVAETEGSVRALEAEKAKRVALGGGPMQVFLRRALTF